MKGFTLIETMVAVTILAFAAAGPLVAASRALVSAEIARDRLTASYLAQEAVEYVRAMRDDAYLAAYQSDITDASVPWGYFVSGTGDAGFSVAGCTASTCTLDPTRTRGTGSGFSLTPCAGNSCGPLYLANGVYTMDSNASGAAPTSFVRTLQASAISGTDELISSTVSWTFHGQTYSVTVRDHLTPWQ